MQPPECIPSSGKEKIPNSLFPSRYVQKGSLSEAELVENREMIATARIFEAFWMHQYERPVALVFDPEFNKEPFLEVLHPHCISPERRPARGYKNVGQVERIHGPIKTLLGRIYLFISESTELAGEAWNISRDLSCSPVELFRE